MVRKVVILVLALGAVVAGSMTVVSYTGRVSLDYYMPDRSIWYQLFANRGRLNLHCATDVASFHKKEGPGVYECKLGDDSLFITLPWGKGVVQASFRSFTPSQVRLHSVPGWVPGIIALVFAGYPVFALIRGPVRRYRRRRKGLCLKCGYNLTGNTSGVCSECGTEIQRP